MAEDAETEEGEEREKGREGVVITRGVAVRQRTDRMDVWRVAAAEDVVVGLVKARAAEDVVVGMKKVA